MVRRGRRGKRKEKTDVVRETGVIRETEEVREREIDVIKRDRRDK